MPTVFIPSPLAEVVAKLEAKPAVDLAAEAALADAQEHCPVGETGDLKASLHIEDAPDGGKRVVVGTDYWIFPEFGLSNQAPQVFLRSCIDDVGLHR